ncbi:hypothetical protein [Methanococcoides sp. NM1]|uniref:hypothetical protein n=1 Tax=Methanococcoides sp. NM1 TaxID=1201013 RepID=UPI001083AA67|nr:hypothetical protein [Methanococcoides sp. NM1]
MKNENKVKTIIISLVAISLLLIFNLSSLLGRSTSSSKTIPLLLITVGFAMIGVIYLLEARRTKPENRE